jgi:hypothetical protein
MNQRGLEGESARCVAVEINKLENEKCSSVRARGLNPRKGRARMLRPTLRDETNAFFPGPGCNPGRTDPGQSTWIGPKTRPGWDETNKALFGPNPADALLGQTEPAPRCVLRHEIFWSHLVNVAQLEAA